jgi:glycogen synthase
MAQAQTQAAQFSWAQAAADYLAIYKELLGR